MTVNASRLPARRSQSRLWIVLGTTIFYFYVLATASEGLTVAAALAFGFQLLCLAGALMIAARHSGTHGLRVSDPLLLVLLWSFLYLVLPSVFWLQGAVILRSYYITYDAWFSLQWLHGLFILGFVGGYLLICPAPNFQANVAPARLASGWWLFLLTVIPMLVTVFLRVASGGGALPEVSYGETWYSGQSGIQTAQAQGGIAYLLTQFMSKLWFYPILIQSVGLGLIMSNWILKGRSWMFVLGFAGVITMANQLLSGSTRSSAIIVAIIAVILVDLLARPIPFSIMAIAMVVGLFLFDLLSVVRQAPFSQLMSYLPIAVEKYFSPTFPRLGEFGLMLSKEALMLQLVQTQGGPNPMHLLQNILFVVPSQLNPLKLNWTFTGDLLSREMLGEAYYLGAGVAGSIVGDGLRINGWFGVFLLAVLLGLLVGTVQRWAMGGRGLPRGTNLLRICLWAGFLGWTFNFIRSDLGSLLTILIYYVVLPWYVVHLFPVRQTWKWLAPLIQRSKEIDRYKRKIGLHPPGMNTPSRPSTTEIEHGEG